MTKRQVENLKKFAETEQERMENHHPVPSPLAELLMCIVILAIFMAVVFGGISFLNWILR